MHPSSAARLALGLQQSLMAHQMFPGGGAYFKTTFIYICMLCVCVYMHGHLCAVADMQRSEDSLLGSVFSFHQVDPRD